MRHTIMSNRFAGVLLIATLSLALSAVSPGQTPVSGKALFQASKAQGPSNARRRFPGVLRSRPVSIDMKTIASLRKGDTLRLSLFDDLDLRGEITYYRRTHRGTQQWAGHIPGLPGSSILLAEAEGTLAGLIRGPGLQLIRLHSAGGGRYEVIQLEAEKQPECGVDQGVNFLPRAGKDPAGGFANKSAFGVSSCDSGLVIDLMVVYSAEARDAAANMPNGDPSAILAEIDLAELDVNTSYANSLISPRINVVHSALLLQAETSPFSGMLTQLTSLSDGVYDEVHALRDLHGADMVAMLVANSGLGGVAWLMDSLDPSFQAFAFSVTNWARAADSVLAHELGHNQGCCHDRDNCGGGVFSYSFGHRYMGTDGIQYRTVMSYLPGTWIKHFSSPLVNFAGAPTGEAQTDNARTINETSAVIANFRQTPVPPPSAALTGTGLERLVAPVRVTNDFFGISVAIDGDVVVVGADLSDESLFADAGAAFVYRFDGFAWQWEATLTASDASVSDSFGASVAIEGDLIVVGATLTDVPGLNNGAAYVFRFDGFNWNEEAKLLAMDAGSLDLAGTSVDISGNRVVVGAPQDNDNGPDSGSAYVFEYNPASAIWEEKQKLVAADAAFGDNFGQSVSISGDLLVVGAWLDNEIIVADSGAAYVFGFDSASQIWIQDAKLQAPAIAGSAFFGVSVSLSPDAINGDVILIGAYGADGVDDVGVPVPGSGSAYVFRDTGPAWGFEQELPVPTSLIQGGFDNGFGFAVTVGENIAAVGVPFSGKGAFARYEFGGVAWSNTATVINATDESLGISIDNDPVTNNIIIGAWTADNAAGAAYIFSGDISLNDCNGNGLPDDCDVLEGRSLDCNSNGIPDECDIDTAGGGTSLDCNSNGIPDECDISDGTVTDCNLNGIPDGCDLIDGTLLDTNNDGIADVCQDCDNNTLFDPDEIAADPTLDCNLNGVLDVCDLADGTSADLNLDGIPDECGDCNLNGIPDFQDVINGAPDVNLNNIPDECDPDCNNNGIPDDFDILVGTSIDANDDGIPDECDPDCDNDGVSDLLQIIQGVHPDCNLNGIPDVCDIADLTSGDCNDSGIPDECEIALGLLDDVNMDGIPDICQDCNLNGILDPDDLAAGTSRDCNLSGIPDECESGDRNGNGIPDFCEDCNNNLNPDYLDIVQGTSNDLNGNTIPDECDKRGDVNDDLVVNVTDLLILLSGWGFCTTNPCPGDLDFNGTINVSDLLILLANWGV